MGHSLGASNIGDVSNWLRENTDIKVDLLVTIDPASQKNPGSESIALPSNVRYAVNFVSDPEYNHSALRVDGGKVSLSNSNNGQTKFTNLKVNKTEHTTIDNTIVNQVVRIMNNFLFQNGDPVDYANKIDLDKLPIYVDPNPKKGGSSN